MCGISGYWYFNKKEKHVDTIINMSHEIAHRGPDDEGFVFIDTHEKKVKNFSSQNSMAEIKKRFTQIKNQPLPFYHDIAMAHRRFSILDLSPAAHQPMWNTDKSLCIVFNGEIFNYLELKEILKNKGIIFKTKSDTEVILAAYEFWGYESFSKFCGFWAIALYDSKKNILILSRDRIGKKPLYIYKNRNVLVWASEIKSIFKLIDTSMVILDDEVMYNYLISGIKDFNHTTFWKEIKMMDNATYTVVTQDGKWNNRVYWELPKERLKEVEIDFDYAKEKFKEILKVSLVERLRADVPIAFELSGGLDSSSLVALKATLNKSNFSAFTVKYEDKKVDESPYALKLVKQYPHINHHLINFEEENLWNFLKDYLYLLEEPFHGPVLLIGQLLRKKMREKGFRVIIGGAGGDEVFAGYTEYAIPTLRKLVKNHQYMKFFKNCIFYKEKYPLHIIPFTKLILKKICNKQGDRIFFQKYLVTNKNYPIFQKYPKDIDDLYIKNMKDLKMYYWMSSNDKSDMGIPIEVRNPFLDHRVVDFLFTLPVSYFFNNGWLKWFLRKSFQGILPDIILWRKRKKGFPFPLDKWMLKNERILKTLIRKHDNQWINNKNVTVDFENLVKKNPEFLWRIINFLLWYSIFVCNEK